MRNQGGFTLIEMAMVIAIVGLFIGGGLMAVGPFVQRAHVNTTATNLDQIENALVLFAIRNNRLPCPANGADALGTATYGKEQVGTRAGIATTCSVATTNAVIPWITLGLDENTSVDGWGRRITYVPAHRGLATTVDSLVDDTLTACQPGTATCTLCLSRTTGASGSSTRQMTCDYLSSPISPSYPWGNYIPIYAVGTSSELTAPQPNGACPGSAVGTDAQVAAAPTTVNCAGGRAAYVLISHGRSGWYGWNKPGVGAMVPALVTGDTNKSYNSAGTASDGTGPGFYQGGPIGVWPAGSNQSYFDDIVRWRSPAMLIQLCGAGACGNP